MADFNQEKRRNDADNVTLQKAIRESMREKDRLEAEKLREDSLINAVSFLKDNFSFKINIIFKDYEHVTRRKNDH